MRVFWIGFHVEGAMAFNILLEKNHLVGVMSLNEEASSKRSGVYNYQELCANHDIPYYPVKHVNDDSSVEIMKKANPDLLIVLGWSQILSEVVLNIPKIGTIGAHASLLPKMRGSAPINWALIRGLEETGNTLMWLNPGVDTGMILDQYKFEINKYDSCKTLYDKVAESNKIMLERSLPKIVEAGQYGIQQVEHEGDELLPRRRPKDGLIDFNQSTRQVYDFIRALTRPYPGAFCDYKKSKVFLWRASYDANKVKKGTPGEILYHVVSFDSSLCGVAIQTNDGVIVIHEATKDKETLLGERLHEFFKIGDILNYE